MLPTARRRAAIAGGVLAYASVAALCRPLTGPALAAVLLAGLPLCWLGVRRRPVRSRPVDNRSDDGTVAGAREDAGDGIAVVAREDAGDGTVAVAREDARRSMAVWLGLGAVAGAFELALRLGPNDVAHPTLSTLADPVLATYPGRVAGYALWLGAGLWLAGR